jgi:AMP nucleosidase
MLGHCAGLSNSQNLGDYVLAHGYVREDHVLDNELPMWVPIPALAEMQIALELAVGEVTGLAGFEQKRVMRTGTVASVDNRNWEIGDPAIIRRLSQARAIALDMESATIASACHTAPYSACRISPCMVKSNSPAWPANSIASVSASISRSG